MGFRITDSPFPQRMSMAPYFHAPLRHRPRISMDGRQSEVAAETAAFGYPARALVFEQRVELGPLAIRDMRRR